VSELTCRQVADSAPGFALDILEPTTRARVAAHLIRCPGCRETVTGMQDSASRLLDLGTPWEETEWADDDTGSLLSQVRPARRRLRMVVSMATVALLIVGTTLGPELEQLASHPEQPLATVYLRAGGSTVGTVRVFAGPTPALDVQVEGMAAGSLQIMAVDASGQARAVAHLQVPRSGRAAWLGAEPLPLNRLSGVVLVDSAHQQVAAATF